jgi:hypothetical protein
MDKATLILPSPTSQILLRFCDKKGGTHEHGLRLTSKALKPLTPEEIKELLEVSFEHVCEKDGLLFFRKEIIRR